MLKKMSGGAYPITPSDVSPVALTAGEMYDVMSSGYAIEHSPVPLDPSEYSSGASVSSGDIARFTGNGKVIPGSYEIIPDNTNPPQLTAAKFYYTRGAGYAIQSLPTTITPSSTPQNVSISGGLYRFNGSGKVVDDILTLTTNPSNTRFIVFPQYTTVRNPFSDSACICALNTKIGRTGTIPDTEGNAVTVTVDTGLNTVSSFVLICLGHKSSKYHAVVSWNVNDSSNYEGQCTYGEGTSGISGVWVKKALDNNITAWVPTLVSVSGGTVTLKTGANANSGIKNGLWIACSAPGG